jgi:hypothetical protein
MRKEVGKERERKNSLCIRERKKGAAASSPLVGLQSSTRPDRKKSLTHPVLLQIEDDVERAERPRPEHDRVRLWAFCVDAGVDVVS